MAALRKDTNVIVLSSANPKNPVAGVRRSP
jgi:hypothetical protein